MLDFAGAESAAVQIASDLHLEFHRAGCGAELDMDAIVTPTAPILALLGDIGIPTHPLYRTFLLHQAERFAAVLVLTGNHEFYDIIHKPTPPPKEGQTYKEAQRDKVRHGVEDMERAIQAICDEHPRLHYVDNRVVRLGRGGTAAALLCTPMWSHVPAAAAQDVCRGLNDYRMCWVRKQYAQLSEMQEDKRNHPARNALGQALRRLSVEDTSGWHALAVGCGLLKAGPATLAIRSTIAMSLCTC